MVKYAGAGGVGAAVRLLDKFAVLTFSSACINVRDLTVIPLQFAPGNVKRHVNARYRRICSRDIKRKNLC